MAAHHWQVRPARPSDLAAVARIHVDAWRAAYRGLLPDAYLQQLSSGARVAYWQSYLQRDSGALCVALRGTTTISPQSLIADAGGDEPVGGWLSYGRTRDAERPPGTAELYAFYVDPARWSGGAGRALWAATRADLIALGYRRVDVWVLCGNARAMRFYRGIGMRIGAAAQRAVAIGGRRVTEVRMSRALRGTVSAPDDDGPADAGG